MQSDMLQCIAEIQSAQGEIIDRQNNLLNDLFWILIQHMSTEELTGQLEEMQNLERIKDKLEC